MASVWKGALSFGLVNVQVKLHPATQDNDVSFHQVHAEDGGRIRYKRTCEVCGEVVEYRDIAKAYESHSGQTVIITEKDLESLPTSRSREIDVVEFVPADQVDPILFDKTYYLEPDPSALRPYVLLREALRETDRMAIAKVALRSKVRLASLRVKDDVIVLQTMLWADEIRPVSFASLEGDVEIRDQELKMAASLIETLEADFNPEEFQDDYRVELLSMLEKKLETGDGTLEVEEETEKKPELAGGNVVDLLSALQASIDKTAKAREESGGKKAPAAKKEPAKKAPAKKAAAKKAPAKKTAAKKTAAKKAS